MSGRTNLAELRAAIADADVYIVGAEDGVLLALVEAVEAAHDFLPRYYGDEQTSLAAPQVEQSAHRLARAVGKFDFGAAAGAQGDA